MKIYGLDWAHDPEKIFYYDGENEPSNKKPKLNKEDIIVTENIPDKQLEEFIKTGIKVLSTQTNKVQEWLLANDLEKNDKNDAIALYNLYQEDPEQFWVAESKSKLYCAYALFKSIQHLKVMLKNRTFIYDDEQNQHNVAEMLKLEKYNLKTVTEELENYPIWTEYLVSIKGVGGSLAGGLISFIKDIKKFDNISRLWSYFGMSINGNGIAPKRRRGESCNWHHKAKSLCFLLSEQFIRQKHPVLKQIYDTEKEKQLANVYEAGELFKNFGKPYKKGDTKLRKIHAHMRAKRKIVKIFLSCVWLKWRELEGLSITRPYTDEKLKHNHIIEPKELIVAEIIPFPMKNNEPIKK